MPPRRRALFTAESIDQQLQQIHLLDGSSSSENLEQLGPIIKSVYSSRHQEAYLRTLKQLVENKDKEIEEICGENYQDFVSSVNTLLTVRQYTNNLQDKITTLDGSVHSVGKALLAKKKQLLELKSTAANLDTAIDALQSCLSLLDVVQRVGDMIKQGKFWSALRVGPDLPHSCFCSSISSRWTRYRVFLQRRWPNPHSSPISSPPCHH
jgi:exocyst complex component 6